MTTTRPAPSLPATLFATSRPLSWVNTAYPFAAAHLLSGGDVGPVLVLGTVFFLIPYNLAMYGINDVFDLESDLLNPRKGGVEGALTERSRHRAILVASAIGCLPFLAFLYAAGTVASGAALTVVMVAVVAYSARGLRFKEIPFLDSATSATHFVGPAVVGMLMTGSPVGTTSVAVLASFFLWSMASQAFGAVQDIRADREAGLASIGTVLGAAATVRLAIALYAGAGLLMLAAPWPFTLIAALAGPYIASIWPFRSLNDTRCEGAHAGWRRFLWLNYVTGFLITMVILFHALG